MVYEIVIVIVIVGIYKSKNGAGVLECRSGSRRWQRIEREVREGGREGGQGVAAKGMERKDQSIFLADLGKGRARLKEEEKRREE